MNDHIPTTYGRLSVIINANSEQHDFFAQHLILSEAPNLK